MKLLYNTVDGEIFYAVPDINCFYFRHTTNISLDEYAIDEIDPDNKNICQDLLAHVGRTDKNGLGKYYMDSGTLMEREGWAEHMEEVY